MIRSFYWAIQVYLNQLAMEGVYSRSHVTLRQLYHYYGKTRVDNTLDRLWALKARKGVAV